MSLVKKAGGQNTAGPADALPQQSSGTPLSGAELRINHDDGVPLWEQVKRLISERILLGDWPPGTVLPGETRLARELGVAVGTLRRALADLTGEGLLMRRRKAGTMVTGRTPHHSLRFFFQYFRLHGRDGRMLRSRAEVLDLAEGLMSAAEAEALQGAAGERVIRIHRLRRVDGRALMHQHMTIKAARLPDFPSGDDLPELLYLFLLERYGIRISAVRESLAAELASEEDRRVLGLEEMTAVLAIEQVAYDHAGAPILWGTCRAITDDARYINEIR